MIAVCVDSVINTVAFRGAVILSVCWVLAMWRWRSTVMWVVMSLVHMAVVVLWVWWVTLLILCVSVVVDHLQSSNMQSYLEKTIHVIMFLCTSS